MTTFFLSQLHSPLGLIHFIHQNDIVYALEFEEFQPRLIQSLTRYYSHPIELQQAKNSTIDALLTTYFCGDITALNRISTHALGTTFQQSVWQALRTIPTGQTASYKEIAQQIGLENGQRAVGMANAKNPISLVIPCHRVVNSNGQLGGYSGGLWRKEWLLNHEKQRG